MPWAKVRCWKCQIDVPIDEAVEHYAACLTLPPAYIHMIVSKLKADRRHALPKLTTTGIMACPRQRLIPHYMNCILDPVKRLPLIAGTVFHEAMAEFDRPGYFSERCTCPPPFPMDNMTQEVEQEIMVMYGKGLMVIDDQWHLRDCNVALNTFYGKFGGIEISGRTDAIEVLPDRSIRMFDWKMRSAWKSRMDTPEMEDICQLNINRILAEQMGLTVEGMYSGQFPWSSILFQRVPWMDEEEILEFRPKAGKMGVPPTIRELMMLQKSVHDLIGKGLDPLDVVALLPFTGTERYKSANTKNECTEYCGCSVECAKIGRR